MATVSVAGGGFAGGGGVVEPGARIWRSTQFWFTASPEKIGSKLTMISAAFGSLGIDVVVVIVKLAPVSPGRIRMQVVESVIPLKPFLVMKYGISNGTGLSREKSAWTVWPATAGFGVSVRPTTLGVVGGEAWRARPPPAPGPAGRRPGAAAPRR